MAETNSRLILDENVESLTYQAWSPGLIIRCLFQSGWCWRALPLMETPIYDRTQWFRNTMEHIYRLNSAAVKTGARILEKLEPAVNLLNESQFKSVLRVRLSCWISLHRWCQVTESANPGIKIAISADKYTAASEPCQSKSASRQSIQRSSPLFGMEGNMFAKEGRHLYFCQVSSSQLLQRRFVVAQIRPATKKGAKSSSQQGELPSEGKSALWKFQHSYLCKEWTITPEMPFPSVGRVI